MVDSLGQIKTLHQHPFRFSKGRHNVWPFLRGMLLQHPISWKDRTQACHPWAEVQNSCAERVPHMQPELCMSDLQVLPYASPPTTILLSRKMYTATHTAPPCESNKNVPFNKLCFVKEEGRLCQPSFPALAQHSPSLPSAILPLNSEWFQTQVQLSASLEYKTALTSWQQEWCYWSSSHPFLQECQVLWDQSNGTGWPPTTSPAPLTMDTLALHQK